MRTSDAHHETQPAERDVDELCCWVALHSVEGMGPMTFRRLVDRFGTARAVVTQSTVETLAEVRGATRELAEAILKSRDSIEATARNGETLQGRGVRLLRISAQGYPRALLDLRDPPPLLYLVGEIGREDARCVGMVGTTKPSDRGRRIAETFAARLAQAGATIVSGYAHGIDAASHRGAFGAGGRSILCLPYGIRHYKPRPDFPPLSEIVRRGALVSECPPDQEWSSRAAVARNRIIAALSRALFVIETRARGGTMHTAKAAEGLGRPIFALKYRRPPDSARGNAILFGRGAASVHTYGEVAKILECLNPSDG